MIDRLVDIGCQFLLPLSVRIRKLQRLDGRLSDLLPLKAVIRPLPILLHHSQKPLLQLCKSIVEMKIPDFFRLHMTVCHPHPDLRQVLLFGIYVCVTTGLRKMHRHRPFHLLQILKRAFDLIYGYRHLLCLLDGVRLYFLPRSGFLHSLRRLPRLCLCLQIPGCFCKQKRQFPRQGRLRFHLSKFRNDTIRTALHKDLVLSCIVRIAQRDFRLIFRSHPPLDHTMDPAALLHGMIRGRRPSIINIAGTQYELHQAPDRNSYLHNNSHARYPNKYSQFIVPAFLTP